MTSDRQATAQPSSAGEPSHALVRSLKIAVVGMGLLIVVGLGAVIWRIVELASSPKADTAVPAISAPAAGGGGASEQALSRGGAPAADAAWLPEVELALPPDAAIRSVSLDGGHLAVHYEAPTGTGIAVLDLASGRPASHVRIGSAPR